MSEPALFISTGGRDQDAVRILNDCFTEAAQFGISDIHFEDFEDGCRIRYRVDGRLRERAVLDHHIAKEVTTKIRMRAKMSLSDRDVPLDGRIHLFIEGRIIDVRVSLVPTNHGESIVCRLLDQRNAGLPFEGIEMPDSVRSALKRALAAPDGMVLATGPTGSGKTTTLYSLLAELNSVDRKIVTIEDPVEYRLPYAIQIPITPGMTFARAIRAVLRQDPDVILVGEIRDRETVRTAVQAAMTGHLVFSTLHANDCLTTLDRLLDLMTDDDRPDPFTLEISLRGIIAQRLVRRLCNCAAPHVPLNGDKDWLEHICGADKSYTLYSPQSCEHCNGTGFRGRAPVIEYLEIDRAVRKAIHARDRETLASAARSQTHYETLVQAGARLALDGVTTIQEVRRVLGDLEN